jgi:hypothetical protein
MPTPANCAELRTLIDERWSALTATINTLSDEELVVEGPDGWSVKDHMAHLTAWERSLLALLEGGSRAAAVGIDPELFGQLDTDGIIALIVEAARKHSLDDVRTLFRETHETLRKEVAALSDADISKPYAHFQPNDPAADQHPVVGWINGNTWDHYNEHEPWIRAIFPGRFDA